MGKKLPDRRIGRGVDLQVISHRKDGEVSDGHTVLPQKEKVSRMSFGEKGEGKKSGNLFFERKEGRDRGAIHEGMYTPLSRGKPKDEGGGKVVSTPHNSRRPPPIGCLAGGKGGCGGGAGKK